MLNTKHELEWDYVSEGVWEAMSVLNDEGSSFNHRVSIYSEGCFWIESDRELNHNKVTIKFETLDKAKNYCQQVEDDVMDNLKQENATNP